MRVGVTTERLWASRVTSRIITGQVEPLGEIERLTRHVVGLLLIGRFQAQDAGEVGVVPGVLFVLGGVHAGVVGHGHHEAAG